GVIFEHEIGRFEDSRPLDVKPLEGVHQNVVDRGILKQWLQGSKTEDFIHHFAGEALPLEAAQASVGIGHELLDNAENLRSGSPIAHIHELFEVYLAQ